MPEADIVPTTTRRGALRLGGIFALVTGTGHGTQASTFAELYRGLIAAQQRVDLVAETGDLLINGISPESLVYDEQMDAAAVHLQTVIWQVAGHAARTPAELRMKVESLRIALETNVCVNEGQTIADLDEMGDIEDVMAWSLARDILVFLQEAA